MKVYNPKYQTERDVEIPRLLEFVDSKENLKSVLDVGCSGAYYLEDLRKRVDVIDGADFDRVKETVGLLDNFFEGDFVEKDIGKYDLVMAVSAIEHYRVTRKKVNFPLHSQQKLIKKMAVASKKYLYFTIPYGKGLLLKDHYMEYSKNRLGDTLWKTKGFDLEPSFWFNPDPPGGSGWSEISQSAADKIEYKKDKGTQCVCIVEGIKH